MRTILTILLIIFFRECFSQSGTFPQPQQMGTKDTRIFTNGTFQTFTGFTWGFNYPDTSFLNNEPYLKYTPGIVVRVNSTEFWVRTQDKSRWVQVGGGGGSGNLNTVLNLGNVADTNINLTRIVADDPTNDIIPAASVQANFLGYTTSGEDANLNIVGSNISTWNNGTMMVHVDVGDGNWDPVASFGAFGFSSIGDFRSYGTTYLLNTNLGGSSDSILVIASDNSVKAVARTSLISGTPNSVAYYNSATGVLNPGIGEVEIRESANALSNTMGMLRVWYRNSASLGPEALLHMSGNDIGNMYSRIYNAYTGSSNGNAVSYQLVDSADNKVAQLYLGHSTNAFTAGGLMLHTNANFFKIQAEVGYIGLNVGALGGPTANEIARVTTTGFGIGTQTVTHALTVNGQVRINNINNASVFDSVLVINAGVVEARLASTIVGSAPPLSTISAALATNSILNSTFAQTWDWDQLRTGNALTIAGSLLASTTTGDIKLLNLTANDIVVQDGHTFYGVFSDVTTAGGVGPTTSRNIAVYASAANSIVNHAIFVNAGTVNLNPLTATTILGLNASKNIVSAALSGLTWDGTTLTVTGGATTWNGISNPTGDQALTFDAGESSTWTNSNTTEDLFTINSSTLTTASFLSLNSTGTALASGNNLAELIMSGANGTNAITATALRINVANTNATSGTNVGINVTALGATTDNLALLLDRKMQILPSGTGTAEFRMSSASGGAAAFNFVMTYDNARTFIMDSRDDWFFRINGSPRMTLGSATLRINAASTAYNFQVESDADANALYVNGTTDRVGIGTNAPGAWLQIKAGTTAVTPFMLTTGTSATVAVAGAMEYTTPQLFFTNGGLQRQEIAQIQQSRVSTQYDNTTTTLGNVTGLTSTVVAAGVYRFEALLYTTSNVGGGVKVAIGGTATATAIIYEGLTTDAGATTQARATALGTAVGAVTAVTAAYVRVTGTITVNAAGTLTVQAAANTAVGTTSVLVGSTFVLTQML